MSRLKTIARVKARRSNRKRRKERRMLKRQRQRANGQAVHEFTLARTFKKILKVFGIKGEQNV